MVVNEKGKQDCSTTHCSQSSCWQGGAVQSCTSAIVDDKRRRSPNAPEKTQRSECRAHPSTFGRKINTHQGEGKKIPDSALPPSPISPCKLSPVDSTALRLVTSCEMTTPRGEKTKNKTKICLDARKKEKKKDL